VKIITLITHYKDFCWQWVAASSKKQGAWREERGAWRGEQRFRMTSSLFNDHCNRILNLNS
jgi:hypothetical protein